MGLGRQLPRLTCSQMSVLSAAPGPRFPPYPDTRGAALLLARDNLYRVPHNPGHRRSGQDPQSRSIPPGVGICAWHSQPLHRAPRTGGGECLCREVRCQSDESSYTWDMACLAEDRRDSPEDPEVSYWGLLVCSFPGVLDPVLWTSRNRLHTSGTRETSPPSLWRPLSWRAVAGQQGAPQPRGNIHGKLPS